MKRSYAQLHQIRNLDTRDWTAGMDDQLNPIVLTTNAHIKPKGSHFYIQKNPV